MSEIDQEVQFLFLTELAGQSMSALARMVEEECGIDWVFEKCSEATLSDLKHRANHWLSKLAAVEAENKAAR
jgi:hypothetical protein